MSRLITSAVQMHEGTIKVREALGEESPHITDLAIQEALWHYFYDIAKSVSYLKSTSKTMRVGVQLVDRPRPKNTPTTNAQEAKAGLKV